MSSSSSAATFGHFPAGVQLLTVKNGYISTPARSYEPPRNRYTDPDNLRLGRYQTKKPDLRHTKLREDTNPQAHIHVNASINLGLPAIRRANIARAMATGNVGRVFGTEIDYGQTNNDLLTIDQNDPVFVYRDASRRTGFVNTLAESTPTVVGRINGVVIDENDTQETFQRKFRFAGWAVTRKAYYEPGSKLAVAVSGSRTIWLGPTNVDWGDRLRWRFPSIDPVTREHESQYEHPPNGRPAKSYGAIIERMDPIDVVLMPQSTLTRMFKPSKEERRLLLRQTALARIHNKDPLLPSEKLPIDSTESWYVNQYMATMWMGFAGALYARKHGANTFEEMAQLFGFEMRPPSNNGRGGAAAAAAAAQSVHSSVHPDTPDTFFGIANRGLFNDADLQLEYTERLNECVRAALQSSAAQLNPQALTHLLDTVGRIQSTASTAALIALTVAVEEFNSYFVGIAHQRGWGGGKCDQYS